MESISSMKSSSLKNNSTHVREHVHHSRWISTGHDKRVPEARHRFHSQKNLLSSRSHGCSDSSDFRIRPSSASILKQQEPGLIGRHSSSLGFRKPSILHIDRPEPNLRPYSPRKSSIDNDHLRPETPKSVVSAQNPRKSSLDHDYLRPETPKSIVSVQNPRSINSSQKSVGNAHRRPDRRQVLTPKTSSVGDEEASSLRSPIASTNSAENLCHSKIYVHHASPRSGVSESDKISPRQPERAGSRIEPSKPSPKQERFEKVSRRTSKVSPKPLSEPAEGKREDTKRPFFSSSSSRKSAASSDDVHCRNNNFSAKDRHMKKTPEIDFDKKRVDIFIPFRHITRRARSERKREDTAKVQIIEDVSLDGFSVELEQAILKRMENETDTPVEEIKSDSTKEEAGSKEEYSMDSRKRDSEVRSTEFATQETQLETDILVQGRQVKKISRMQETRSKNDTVTEEMTPMERSTDEIVTSKKYETSNTVSVVPLQENVSKFSISRMQETRSKIDAMTEEMMPTVLSSDEIMTPKKYEAQDAVSVLSLQENVSKLPISRMQETRSKIDATREETTPRELSSDERTTKKYEAKDAVNVLDNVSKLPISEEIPTEMEEGEVVPERDLVDTTFSKGAEKMQVNIEAGTTHKEGEASEDCLNAKDGSQSTFESCEFKKTDEGISRYEEVILRQKGDSFVDKNGDGHYELSQENGADAHIEKDVGDCVNNVAATCTEIVSPHVSVSEELTLSLSMRPTGSHTVTLNRHLFHPNKVESADCGHEKEIMQPEKSLRFPVLHVKELDDRVDHGHRQKKLKAEYLQLTLAPPVSASLDSSAKVGDPMKVHHSLHVDRSNSFSQTASDGFMSSMLETSFEHNPSCSLQHSSYKNHNISSGESRPVSETFDWSTHKSLQKQTGSDQIEIDSATGFSGHKTKRSLFALEKLISLPLINEPNEDSLINKKNKQKMVETQTQSIVRSQDQQGSKAFPAINRPQIQSELLGHPSFFVKSCDTGRTELFIEKIGLREISSEPILVMAQKLQELPDSFLEGLKDLVKELLGNFAKRDEFLLLQKIVRERKDLTEETLLRAHPTQLDILVALKTGMLTFVHKNTRILTYKALIEIFLQKRCQNVACQQPVPVDGCECTICSQKNGFCHDCMCMACSKFDSENHTSRWVGCDICNHWCHTDCGLRMSYIKPTPTEKDGIRSSQIQFKCASCGHDMELFGFVKEVFDKSAQSWNAEALAKELDCVRRIFHGSEDMREQELYWKAEEMLQKLENNVDANHVRDSMLRFFSESQINPTQPKGACEYVMDSSGTKLKGSQELFVRKEKGNKAEALLDSITTRNNLEIIWKLEAKSFQERADESLKDAMRINDILSQKRKMFQDDSSLKYAESRLEEAKERRKKQCEVLQMLEASQCEYQRMKARIESDMKILMAKMTKQRS